MGRTGDEGEDLARRVAALERTVERLERRIASFEPRTGPEQPSSHERDAPDRQAPVFPEAPAPSGAWPPGTPVSAPRRGSPAIGEPTARPATLPVLTGDPGQWVNRLGIALLLLGAAFGFKYSIDRGWIGPAVRVAAGLGLGALLLAASVVVRTMRPGLSRVLAGGGIACGYLSIFAAFRLYELVSHPVAFAAMSAVTVLAFVVAVTSDDAMAATVATIGGLATPILLHTGGGNASGLVGYTCLVVAGAGAVFTKSGWRVVLWTATFGGWMLLVIAAEDLSPHGGFQAAAVQLGIVFVALATWWLAVLREMLAAEDPQRWRPTTAGLRMAVTLLPVDPPRQPWSAQPHQLALATPLVVLLASGWNWELSKVESGWTALVVAGAWSVGALHLGRLALAPARGLAVTHAMGAAVMVALAIALLLTDDAERIGLALEALAVVVAASRLREPHVARLGHLLFAVVGLLTFARIVGDIEAGASGVHAAEVADLVVVAALGAAARFAGASARSLYFVAAEAGLLVWLVRVLGPLDNGAAWVTAAWFTNAVALVVAGLRTDHGAVRRAGAAVMALTMGKLFVLDLATVDAGWRIVIFLVFGAVLLGLGYAFPTLWKHGPAEPPR